MQPSSIKYPIMPAMVHSDASLYVKRGLNIYKMEWKCVMIGLTCVIGLVCAVYCRFVLCIVTHVV